MYMLKKACYRFLILCNVLDVSLNPSHKLCFVMLINTENTTCRHISLKHFFVAKILGIQPLAQCKDQQLWVKIATNMFHIPCMLQFFSSCDQNIVCFLLLQVEDIVVRPEAEMAIIRLHDGAMIKGTQASFTRFIHNTSGQLLTANIPSFILIYSSMLNLSVYWFTQRLGKQIYTIQCS